MLKNIVMIVILSWACNNFCMDTQAQKEDFRKVAAHLGFRSTELELKFSESGKIIYACQQFGPGWIFLRASNKNLFKIANCALDRGDCAETHKNFYQTEWLTLAQALAYMPDMTVKE